MKKHLGKIILSLCLVFSLTGCGQSASTVQENQNNEGTEVGTEVTTGDTEAVIEEDGDKIIVNTSRGELTLDRAAIKVVSLDWTVTEELVAIGVQPIGAADIVGYETYISSEVALDESVVDVGTRNEPNLEVIASLQPDLIISNKGGNEAIYDQLNEIAPTMELDMTGETGYGYELMSELFKEIAKTVGKESEAETVLTELDEYIATAKAGLESAGISDFHYVVTQTYNYQNTTYLRMFADNSLMSETLEKMGMINDWETEQLEVYAFSTIELEGLSAVLDSNFLYILQSDGDIFGDNMAENTTWNELNFVKESRTYSLDSQTWPFGGPISTKLLVDSVVEAIVNE